MSYALLHQTDILRQKNPSNRGENKCITSIRVKIIKPNGEIEICPVQNAMLMSDQSLRVPLYDNISCRVKQNEVCMKMKLCNVHPYLYIIFPSRKLAEYEFDKFFKSGILDVTDSEKYEFICNLCGTYLYRMKPKE